LLKLFRYYFFTIISEEGGGGANFSKDLAKSSEVLEDKTN